MDYVFHHLAAELVGLACGQHANAAGRQRNRFDLLKTSALNFNVEAEPVTAIKPPSGIEAYGRGNRSFEIISGDGQNAVADMLVPGIAASVSFYAAGRLYRSDWFRFDVEIERGRFEKIEPVTLPARRVRVLATRQADKFRRQMVKDVVHQTVGAKRANGDFE